MFNSAVNLRNLLIKVQCSKDNDAKPKMRKKFGSSHTRTNEQKSAAQKDVRKFLESLSADTIRCFTDGSCVGNPGLVVREYTFNSPSKEIKHYRYLGEGTNNKAELSAVLDAMGLLEDEGVDTNTPIVVCTDSQYVVGILTKNLESQGKTRTSYFHFGQPLKSGMTSLFVGWLVMPIFQRMMRRTVWRTLPLQKDEPSRVDVALDAVWSSR